MEAALCAGSVAATALPFEAVLLTSATLVARPEGVDGECVDSLSSMTSAFPPNASELHQDSTLGFAFAEALPLESALVGTATMSSDRFGGKTAVDSLEDDPVTWTTTFPVAPESDDAWSLGSAQGAGGSLEDTALESAEADIGEYTHPALTRLGEEAGCPEPMGFGERLYYTAVGIEATSRRRRCGGVGTHSVHRGSRGLRQPGYHEGHLASGFSRMLPRQDRAQGSPVRSAGAISSWLVH